jgi:hypothetical protein
MSDVILSLEPSRITHLAALCILFRFERLDAFHQVRRVLILVVNHRDVLSTDILVKHDDNTDFAMHLGRIERPYVVSQRIQVSFDEIGE